MKVMAASRSTRRVRVLVEGRVQGVGFRQSTLETARWLGVTGWVRNLPTRRQVECEAEGNAEAIAAFLQWMDQGPGLARVDRVLVTDIAPQNDPSFRIRP